MTPFQIEKDLIRFEEKLIAKMNSFHFYAWPLILAFSTSLYVWIFYSNWSHAYPNWTRFNLLQDRFWLDLVIISMSVLSFFIPQKVRTSFLGLTIFSAWFFSCYKLKSLDLSSLVFPLYFLSMYLIFKIFSKRHYLKFFSSIFLFGLSAYFIGLLSVQKGDYKVFQFFWTLHPEYLLLSLCAWSFENESWVVFAPHHISIPLPLPPGSRPSTSINNQKKNYLQGILNLFISVSLLTLIMKFLDFKMNFENPFVQNIYSYIIFLLCVVAGFNMATALLRLHLIEVPDATYFVFLAKSPLELWSRGSVYIYRLFFNVIYLPTYRKTRSLALSLAACFLAVYLNLFFFHDIAIRTIFRIFLPDMPVSTMDYMNFIFSNFVWLILWVIFGATFYFVRKIFFRPRAWLDWTCIFFTHAIASQVTFLSSLIVDKLKHF